MSVHVIIGSKFDDDDDVVDIVLCMLYIKCLTYYLYQQVYVCKCCIVLASIMITATNLYIIEDYVTKKYLQNSSE